MPIKGARALIYYETKDYEKECDAIERIFDNYYPKRAKNILDIACGTGLHSMILADRNYNIAGIDSSKIMIKKAIEYNKIRKNKVNFSVQDMRGITLAGKFDCAIMFEAFCHLLTFPDVDLTLSSLKRHLNNAGLFIFDFWNASGATKLACAFGKAHKLRYYTKAEIRQSLVRNGFDLLVVYDWKDKNKTKLESPNNTTFQILAVARLRGSVQN